MKSFWISLIIFCLLMCSCKSKEVATQRLQQLQVQSEVSYLNETARIDTTVTSSSEQMCEIKLIFETITKTEYDTDKNTIKEVTKTERTFIQDSETDRAEEVRNYIETYSQDSLNHIANVSKKVESESETVTSFSGLDSFWKWFGIVLGVSVVIVIAFAYLRKKIKSRVN